MSPVVAESPLSSFLDRLGYSGSLQKQDVTPPGGGAEALDFVGFTRSAPQDIRTSAVSATDSRGRTPETVLQAARLMATPIALIATGTVIHVYRVAATAADDELLQDFPLESPEEWDVSTFKRALDPAALQVAKTGLRQLALFPVDARLLEVARNHSMGTLRTRLESAFATAFDTGKFEAADAARLVITALASVVVRDKYGQGAETTAAVVASALQKHRSYFAHLAEWEANEPELITRVLEELSEGLDYSAVDARSLNSVYEHLFITPELRKELGTFYTDPHFASRILQSLPIEELDPESRCVIDPACGSGNLLLAAQERMEVLAPTSWSAEETHQWLKTHLIGADVDPIATEIAKLSLLVSALPLGNTWRIDTRDFLQSSPSITPTPNLLVTNPPWYNPKARTVEKASEFLRGAVDLLAAGGLLACIMPISWLSADTHSDSRADFNSRCELFEVWRLPRDMFPNARMGCAVLFARKTKTPERKWTAFRWVKAGAPERRRFLDTGDPSFQTVRPRPTSDGAPIVWGPLHDVFRRRPPKLRLGDVATVVAGLKQKGVPAGGRPSQARIPTLPRGKPSPIYRLVDADAVTWVDADDPWVFGKDLETRRSAPKILVQADRFPDNAWRVRPIFDAEGVVPGGGWQAVIPKNEAVCFALIALLASAPVSCWVHSEATGKRISVDVLRDLPLPGRWDAEVRNLSRHGRKLVTKGPETDVLASIEETVGNAYGLTKNDRDAVSAMMAGYDAPEGTVRVKAQVGRVSPVPEHVDSLRAGSVLDIEGNKIRIWLVGETDEGEAVSLPTHMPGWLCEPGSSFDLEGDVREGRYHFHRMAFLSDEEIFGVRPDDDADS